MAKNRYILPESQYGKKFYSPRGPIELSASTSQADLQYLRDDCGLQYIQKGEKPMGLPEQIKIAQAELAVLESKLEKEKGSK